MGVRLGACRCVCLDEISPLGNRDARYRLAGSLGRLLCQLREAGSIDVKTDALTDLVVQRFGNFNRAQAHRVSGIAGAAKLGGQHPLRNSRTSPSASPNGKSTTSSGCKAAMLPVTFAVCERALTVCANDGEKHHIKNQHAANNPKLR